MECTTSLQQWFINPSSTCNNTNGGTCRSRDGLLRTTGKPDSCLVVIRRVTDDSSIVAGSSCEGATVTDLLLNIADDSTFRALGDRENVADVEGGLFAAVDKGTGVETFSSDESLLTKFVAVRIAENDAGKRSTTWKIGNYEPLCLWTRAGAVLTDQHRG